MKKIVNGLLIVSVGMVCFAQSVKAMQIISSPTKKTFFTTLLNMVDSKRRYADENQELFENTCQKMGMDAQTIRFQLGEKEGSYADAQKKLVVLGLDNQRLPVHERAFTIAHELAHIKHGDGKEIPLVNRTLGFFIGYWAYYHLNAVLIKKPVGRVLVSGVCWLALPAVALKNASCFLQKKQEQRADLTAITALHDKQGALDFFGRNCASNKESREELIQQGRVGYANQLFDEQGNDLLDKKHPSLTERIAYCKAALL